MFDTLRQPILRAIQNACNSWEEPDAEFVPALQLFHGEDADIFALVPPENIREELLVPVVRNLFRCYRPFFATLALPMWEKIIPESHPQFPEKIVRARREGLANDPERQDAIHILLCDGERLEAWTVPILRYRNLPPQLGEWQEMTGYTGPLSTVLFEGFRALKRKGRA